MAIISTTSLSLALKTILEKVVTSLEVDAADILLLSPHTPVLEFVRVQRRPLNPDAGRPELPQSTQHVGDIRLTVARMAQRREHDASFCLRVLLLLCQCT